MGFFGAFFCCLLGRKWTKLVMFGWYQHIFLKMLPINFQKNAGKYSFFRLSTFQKTQFKGASEQTEFSTSILASFYFTLIVHSPCRWSDAPSIMNPQTYFTTIIILYYYSTASFNTVMFYAPSDRVFFCSCLCPMAAPVVSRVTAHGVAHLLKTRQRGRTAGPQ